MIDIAIITEEALLTDIGELMAKDADGRYLIEMLDKGGKQCKAVAWDDPNVEWQSIKLGLISSTWNYQEQPETFLLWLDHVERMGCRIINDPRLLRWNLNKKYLLLLDAEGVPIPETYLIASKSALNDKTLLDRFGTGAVVIKPCISASAQGTEMVENFAEFIQSGRVGSLDATGPMLVQPFLQRIVHKGERSIVFIDGLMTHAFNKVPARGDFRVQREFGGIQSLYIPTGEEVAFAKAVMSKVSQLLLQPVYARIDICHDNKDRLVLMELEMIEPELWLHACPEAATRLAEYLLRTCD